MAPDKAVKNHAHLTALAAMLDISGQVIMGQRGFVRSLSPEEGLRWNRLVAKTQVMYIAWVALIGSLLIFGLLGKSDLIVNVLATVLIATIISSPVALVVLQRKLWLK